MNPNEATGSNGRSVAVRQTALYRMFDGSGQLLYVGISVNIGSRFDNHGRDKEWWHEVRTITVTPLPDRVDAVAAERRAVSLEQPLYNERLKKEVTKPLNPKRRPRTGKSLTRTQAAVQATAAEEALGAANRIQKAREIRESSGLSRKELAKRAGMSPETLKRIESDYRQVMQLTRRKWYRAILAFEEEQFGPPSSQSPAP